MILGVLAYRQGAGGGPAPTPDPTLWDSSLKHADVTLSNGDQDMTKAGGTYRSVYATKGQSSGVRAFECLVTTLGSTSSIMIGFANKANSATVIDTFVGTSVLETIGYNNDNLATQGRIYRNMTVGTDSGALTTAYAAGDIITVELDFSANEATFYKNGASVFTRAFTSGQEYFPVASAQNGSAIRIIGGGLTHLPSGATEWDA